MTKLRKVLVTLASALFLVCSAIAVAACDIGVGKKTYYSVSLTYEATQGEVTKTDPADAKGYVADEEVTITVTPKEGYDVDAVKVNDSAVTLTEGKYTFKVTGNMTVNAAFKAKAAPAPEVTYYTVTTGTPEHGALALSAAAAGEGKYVADESVTVTITPDEHYELDTFTVNGADKKADIAEGKYTFTVAGNTEIAATFKLSQYTLTIEAPKATVAVEDEQETYVYGDTVTFTVTPNMYYNLTSVKVNGAAKTEADGKYTFTVEGNTTIAVECATTLADTEFYGKWSIVDTVKQDTFTVDADGIVFTSTEYTGGEECRPTDAVMSGDTLTFTATDATGDGDPVTTAMTFTKYHGLLKTRYHNADRYFRTSELAHAYMPEAYYNTQWLSNSTFYGNLSISETGSILTKAEYYNGSLRANGSLTILAVVYKNDNPDEGLESALLLSSDGVQTLTVVDDSTIKITHPNNGFSTEDTFTKYIPVEDVTLGITFAENYRKPWKEAGISDASGTACFTLYIKENSIRFKDAPLTADNNVTALGDGAGYTFEKDGVTYTIKLMSDKKAIRLSYTGEEKVVFLKQAEVAFYDYTYDTTFYKLPTEYFGQTLYLSKSQNSEDRIADAIGYELTVTDNTEEDTEAGGSGEVGHKLTGFSSVDVLSLNSSEHTATALIGKDSYGWYTLTFETGKITITDETGTKSWVFVADESDKQEYEDHSGGEAASSFTSPWCKEDSPTEYSGVGAYLKWKVYIYKTYLKFTTTGEANRSDSGATDYTSTTQAFKGDDDVIDYYTVNVEGTVYTLRLCEGYETHSDEWSEDDGPRVMQVTADGVEVYLITGLTMNTNAFGYDTFYGKTFTADQEGAPTLTYTGFAKPDYGYGSLKVNGSPLYVETVAVHGDKGVSKKGSYTYFDNITEVELVIDQTTGDFYHVTIEGDKINFYKFWGYWDTPSLVYSYTMS